MTLILILILLVSALVNAIYTDWVGTAISLIAFMYFLERRIAEKN